MDATPEPQYQVVINHEEQYSIWPVGRDLPPGWSSAGFEGDRDACLAHIEEVWTDMRPLSLREKMAADERAAEDPSGADEDGSGADDGR